MPIHELRCAHNAHIDSLRMSIPRKGVIEAGFALPVEEDFTDLMRLDEYLVRDKEASFLLRMEGDHLIEEGICPGDLIIFERSDRYSTGDLCVFLTSEGYRILRYTKQLVERLTLVKNEIDPQFELIGPVVSAIRKYK